MTHLYGNGEVVEGANCPLYIVGEQKDSKELVAKAVNVKSLSVDKFLAQQKGNRGSIVEGYQSRSQVIVMPRNGFNHPQLTNNVADSFLLYRELPCIS
ncbi:hypothetical protein WN943_020728 [Citrus x changshan-huyou]